MHSPGGIHLNAKLPSGSNAGYAKQLARQEHSPTYQQTGCLSCTKLTDTPKHPSDMALPIRGKKNSALPTRAQASTPPTRRPAQAPGPASLTRGQTAEAKRTATLHSRLDKIKWQRNMLQTKEQDKNLQEQLNEEEIANLSEKVFRLMIIKIIQDLSNKRRHKLRRYQKFSKDLEERKNKKTEMEKTITEMKNTQE